LIPAPYGVYRTSDGWLALAMSPLAALAEALDAGELAAMDDELDGTTRRDDIEAIIAPILAARSCAEWVAHLDACRLWSGRVYTYAELAEDPHVRATHAFVEIDHPTAGRLRMPAPPLRLSSTDSAVRLPPPRLGEHTELVLREVCGYGEGRVAELRAAGALGGERQAEVR
jgi:crotonobetainyl-CoA:carnitine CoA-transferase CaiB-like acyl-CoA transferase